MAIGGTPTRGYAGGNEEHRIVSSSTTLRRICKPVVRARGDAVGGQYARDRIPCEKTLERIMLHRREERIVDRGGRAAALRAHGARQRASHRRATYSHGVDVGAVKRGVKRRIAASRTRMCGRSLSRRMSEPGFITRSPRRPHLRSMRHINPLLLYNKWFGPRACGDKSHASRTVDLDARCVCWFGERHARDRSRHAGAIRRRTRCALDDAMRCDAMRCARGPRVPVFCFVASHASSRVAAARAMRASAIAGTTTNHFVDDDDDDWFRAPSRATLESVKKHSNAWLLRQSRGRGSCRAQPRVSS